MCDGQVGHQAPAAHLIAQVVADFHVSAPLACACRYVVLRADRVSGRALLLPLLDNRKSGQTSLTFSASSCITHFEVTKIHKYRALREELRRRYPGYTVKQLNFIIGMQGTTVEHRWRWNLTTLGIERRRQDRIIRKCMTASIEGMQRVLRAETIGGDG